MEVVGLGRVPAAAAEQVAARAVAGGVVDSGAVEDRVAAEVPVVPVDPLEVPDV